jgi:selenide,water dikinase
MTLGSAVPPELVTLAHDPQTSGGLLAAIPNSGADDVRRALDDAGVGHWTVGHVEAADSPGVLVT